MKEIGRETSEQAHYQPATMKVIETIRPKYACPDCKDGVRCAPPPKTAIPKSKATASTLAYVAVSKYVDHLPLDRQVSIFERQGVSLSKQTLCGWIRQISDLLEPIERAQWRSVLSSTVHMADETTVNLQRPGQCRKSILWAYLGDQNELVFDSRQVVRDLCRWLRLVALSAAHSFATAMLDTTSLYKADLAFNEPRAGRTSGASSSRQRATTRNVQIEYWR